MQHCTTDQNLLNMYISREIRESQIMFNLKHKYKFSQSRVAQKSLQPIPNQIQILVSQKPTI